MQWHLLNLKACKQCINYNKYLHISNSICPGLTQGRIQNFEGGGANRKCGAKNAYEFSNVGHFFRKICPTLGTFSQYVPQQGHSLRKM